jgi:hypothetical protein
MVGFGATIALAQRDIKKGLSYSTMSQLGYMMLALGIGSYKAGLFHLITHAYSKAYYFSDPDPSFILWNQLLDIPPVRVKIWLLWVV